MADWTPLAEGDPLPGDPGGLGGLAALLGTDAGELSGVLGDLKKVDAEEVWTGENADRFTAARSKVVPKLKGLADEISKASEALRKCCPGMGNSQNLARTAVTRAREATESLNKANAGLAELASQVALTTGPFMSAPGAPPPPPAPAVWAPNYTGMRDEAQEALDAARRLFEKAREEYDEAVDRCVKDLKKILSDDQKAWEKASRDTTEKMIDFGGQASLAVLGQGTGWNLVGFGRKLVAKGAGRVALMEGHLKKGGIDDHLPYRWVKHDFLEDRALTKPSQFFQSVDEAMKPYGRGIEALTLGQKAWGVFNTEHDRRDLNEAEAVVSTTWKMATTEGASWVGGKVGAEAGAYIGGQFGVALIPVMGPAGPVVGAIGGAMVGAMAGSWAGKQAGKFVQGAGGEGLKIATQGARNLAKGATSVVKHLNPFG